MNGKKLGGFTLLELMVAMGIMAILATLSIAAIRTVQRSTRNTQRRDVINTVNSGIQDFFNNQSGYPQLGTDIIFGQNSVTMNGSTLMALKGATKGLTGTNESSVNGTAYCYTTDPSAGTYRLAVNLEGKGWEQYGTDTTGDCTVNQVTAGGL